MALVGPNDNYICKYDPLDRILRHFKHMHSVIVCCDEEKQTSVTFHEKNDKINIKVVIKYFLYKV